MARYVKKHRTLGSLGPTEEKGFALWAGYELEGIDEDLSEYGLIRVDDESDARGVTTFVRVEPEKLGVKR
ncbi:MAG TPA: hypothetical protein VEK11_25810 [Thermoanaerobaculia bacterium]|nr:hypothetical protein [Thermoanaerobaculia bacterium]